MASVAMLSVAKTAFQRNVFSPLFGSRAAVGAGLTTTFPGPSRSYASYPPHILLKMPALSPTMTQGNVGVWKKQIGEEVVPGDLLVEIETDKAQMDFECQEEGFLARIFVQAGAKDVPVNQVIGILAENKEDVDKFASFTVTDEAEAPSTEAPVPAPSTSTPAIAPAPAAPTSSDRVIASPLAKMLAQTNAIPLNQIQGTGPDGRIIKADVLEFKGKAAPAVAAVAAPAPVAPSATASFVDLPVSGMRKVIAERLTLSKTTLPHFYLTLEINADKLLKLREALNAQSGGKFKLSVNDFIVKASALALLDVPAVNSSWQGSFIRQYSSADIAVAVATPTGLITPIVSAAQGKGLASISNSIKSLAERAREGKLSPAEYQGGTFTISNLGMFGISHFTAIINPPHASILAVGGVSEKVVLDEGAERGFSVSKVMNVTLSCDHRVVDGAVGAQWLQRFKAYLENPLTMML